MFKKESNAGREGQHRSAYLVLLRDTRGLICAGTVDYVADRIGRSPNSVGAIRKRKTYASGNVIVERIPLKTYIARHADDGSMIAAGSLSDVSRRLDVPKSSLSSAAKNGHFLKGTDIALEVIKCPNRSVPDSRRLFDENAYVAGFSQSDASTGLYGFGVEDGGKVA